MRQTTFPKGNNNKPKKWYLVDAKDAVLGRIASRIAMRLLGKDDPNFTTYLNDGSGVIVINAKHVKVTGNKLEKPFYWHTSHRHRCISVSQFLPGRPGEGLPTPAPA